jgi:hypothetical protein
MDWISEYIPLHFLRLQTRRSVSSLNPATMGHLSGKTAIAVTRFPVAPSFDIVVEVVSEVNCIYTLRGADWWRSPLHQGICEVGDAVGGHRCPPFLGTSPQMDRVRDSFFLKKSSDDSTNTERFSHFNTLLVGAPMSNGPNLRGYLFIDTLTIIILYIQIPFLQDRR